MAAGQGTFCDSGEKPRTKAVKGGRGPWAPEEAPCCVLATFEHEWKAEAKKKRHGSLNVPRGAFMAALSVPAEHGQG